MQTERALPWITIIAAVLIGVLLGGALITIQAGKTIDQLYTTNQSLNQQVEQLTSEHHTLEEQLSKKDKQPVIRKISINVQNETTDWVKNQITDKVNQDMQFLIGRKVESLYDAPEVIPKLLDKRVYDIENHKYQLDVNLVIISPTLTIWVQADNME